MTVFARKHPSPVELSRATKTGMTLAVERHVADCSPCAAIWSSFNRIDALARELPVVSRSADHDEEILATILAAASKPKRRARRAWWPAIPALVGAALIAVVVAGRDSDQFVRSVDGPIYRGAVRADAGARFVHTSGAPDEIVRLYQGKISVDVTHLRPGERFRVVVADAEIEGNGTSFDVVADRDTLTTVQVVQGRVDVRPARRSQSVVVAGQRWDVDVRPVWTTLVERAEPVAIEQRAPSVSPHRTTKSVLTIELPVAKLFDRGWQRLQAGDHRAAIESFDEALARYPRDPLAEDIAFWRGVALARAKRSTDAIRALTGFLDGYTASPRQGEASAILGWLLVDAAKLDEAARRFEVARHDSVASVRASAEKGLLAVVALNAHSSP